VKVDGYEYPANKRGNVLQEIVFASFRQRKAIVWNWSSCWNILSHVSKVRRSW